VRDERRQEIESDLWESAHDPETTRQGLVWQVIRRWLLGVPHDVAWRLTRLEVPMTSLIRIGAACCVLCGLVLLVALHHVVTTVPPMPDTAVLVRSAQTPTRLLAPPPPPPPPIGLSGATASNAPWHFARTTYSVASEGATPARVREVRPVYPPVLFSGGVEGDVVVQARITEQGRVTDAEVEPASLLGQSAIDAVQQWEFAPRAATRTPARLTVRVSFSRAR
jgi:TonB family protein